MMTYIMFYVNFTAGMEWGWETAVGMGTEAMRMVWGWYCAYRDGWGWGSISVPMQTSSWLLNCQQSKAALSSNTIVP